MALRDNDALSVFLGESKVNTRFDNWLFYYLVIVRKSNIHFRIGGMSDLRTELAKELKQLYIIADTIIRDREQAIVPINYMKWFEDTKRFRSWFSDQFVGTNILVSDNILGLGLKELCIVQVDSDNLSIPNKITYLEDMKHRWEVRLRVGELFKWVQKGDEAKNIEQAYKAVTAFREQHLPSDAEFATHENFLTFVDCVNLTLQEAKSASVLARRNISQKKYRDESKTKKQINALIDIRTFKNLEKLSQKHGLSKAKIVEMLINIESEKNTYISEKKAAWERGDVS